MVRFWTALKRIRGSTWVKVVVSAVAGSCIVLRLIWPEIKIDAITVGLLILLVVPWVSSIIESAKFPGGWEIKFRDVKAAGAKVTGTAEAPVALLGPPTLGTLAEIDPNLALVGLRIEIERRVRKLASRHNLPEHVPLGRVLYRLRDSGILNEQSVRGLSDLVGAGNQAAHGARVEPAVAKWAVDYAPIVLGALDQILKDSEARQ